MQEKDKQFQSLNICHKLFNYFMNSLFSRSLKRVTLGQLQSPSGSSESPAPPGNHPVILAKGAQSRDGDDDSGSYIQILFKRTEEEEEEEELDHSWTSVDKPTSATEEKKHSPNIDHDKPMRKRIMNSVQAAGRDGGGKSSEQARAGKGSRNVVTIRDDRPMEEYRKAASAYEKKKGKDIYDESLITLGETGPVGKEAKVRPHHLSVTSNINEKSDEFINTRLAAMRNNITESERR